MEHIEQCIAELRVLKRILGEKEKEIQELKTLKQPTNLETTLKQSQDQMHALKSENQKLKESLKLLSDKRKQDRQTIAKWQQVLKSYQEKSQGQPKIAASAPPPAKAQQQDIPTDETHLESSPPRKTATSLSMESQEDADITIKEESQPQLPMDPPAEPIEPPAKRPHIQVTIESLLHRDWHPSDFMINSDLNAGISHAYHEKILGKARAHLECRDCASCKKFQNLTGKKVDSRHREAWKKQNTPPGFWRSGFDTAAESLDRRQTAENVKLEGLERLEHAISNGKYLFKDEKLRDLARKGLIG